MSRPIAVFVAALLAGMGIAASPRPGSDLDVFMQQVLAHRDDNWKKLQEYILNEREVVEVRGPGGMPLWGEHRDYTWYLRDGFFVRSPVSVNGIAVPDADRKKYETDYLKRVKARDQGRRGGPPPSSASSASSASSPSSSAAPDAGDMQSLIKQSRQPEFIDSAYFLHFKFESGKYAFVGKETVDGRELYRVEYYPARLFSHEQDKQARLGRAGKPTHDQNYDATVERMMNKVALVTLWIDPGAHQIIKYTFDNVDLDFFPGSWLVRVDSAKASMTMGQPFPGVWLPHDVEMRIAAQLAVGSFDLQFHTDYTDYKLASTAAHLKGDGRGGGGR